MSDFGRIHAIVVAAKRGGGVVLERWYGRMTELEKAEAREAFAAAADGVNLAHDNHEFVGSFRGAPFVLLPTTDLVFFALGCGEYDEMAREWLVGWWGGGPRTHACVDGWRGGGMDGSLAGWRSAPCRVCGGTVPAGAACVVPSRPSTQTLNLLHANHQCHHRHHHRHQPPQQHKIKQSPACCAS